MVTYMYYLSALKYFSVYFLRIRILGLAGDIEVKTLDPT